MKAQLLKKDGKPEFAVLPIAEYRRLLQRLEELEDIKDFRDYKRSPAESFPAEVVNRLLDEESPVRVCREYRGLTQSQLAEKTGVTVAHISQIEGGKRDVPSSCSGHWPPHSLLMLRCCLAGGMRRDDEGRRVWPLNPNNMK